MAKRERCIVCNKKIKTMTWIGTGVCSDKCRKVRDGDDFADGRH